MEINQAHLEAEISSLEKWYVTSLIELIKIPVYKKTIEKDLAKKDNNEERIKNLENTLEMNKKAKDWHEESSISVEAILKEVYKLRK